MTRKKIAPFKFYTENQRFIVLLMKKIRNGNINIISALQLFSNLNAIL
jgi:hypothetical protein